MILGILTYSELHGLTTNSRPLHTYDGNEIGQGNRQNVGAKNSPFTFTSHVLSTHLDINPYFRAPSCT